MASERSPLRNELKATCQESSYARVRMAMRLHPLGLRELHPPREVQSVYLDTPLNRALEQNLAGISSREKLRFRWYGPERARALGTLERKRRENMLGWKESLRLPAAVDVEGVPRRAFVRSLMALADPVWRELLAHGLEPAQWIAYRREYYTSADAALRVTLDRDLRAWDQRLEPRLSARLAGRLPRLLVVEVKCAPEQHAAAHELLGGLPLMVGRCSKFVLASDPEHGPVPSFLPE